ncbi:AMP-binding protein [Aporhodopirellula aestuarii]|uniref:AMP-binding protein n=1 Tax=Aporhodopirellula aestuarii TaxID=2950107 RepID=A0ABT0U9I7_9BACT|nr:AMP-binding protein [Aporhodopirellula aestuarii]MCM2373548.1 AMP-binding protein [Aporhodopirellula aestuarii]
MHLNTESAAHSSSYRPSLLHVLREHLESHPDRPALTFVNDDGTELTLTYAELYGRVAELSQRILAGRCDSNPSQPEQDAVSTPRPGDRALLLFPAGLEFIIAFLACHHSRLVPVPTCFPKPGRAMAKLDAAAEDCAPELLLGDTKTLEAIDVKRLSPQVASLRFVATDDSASKAPSEKLDDASQQLASESLDQIRDEDLALLQYTSGSTNAPKGVMVSHQNLLSNLESIRYAFGLDAIDQRSDNYTRGVFWLPPYHDMGLIGGILEPLYLGGRSILMSPNSFLSKPLRWLQTISNYGGTVSGAPNFAFELCIDRISPDEAAALDLSSWQVAFCGAEPIAAATLDRFAARFEVAGLRRESLLASYGLAEATLLVASGHSATGVERLRVDRDALANGTATPVAKDHPRNQTRTIVGCGRPGVNMKIEIVDPAERTRVPNGRVGEIWLQGPSIARGYWQRENESEAQFQANIAGAENAGEFLRTGDLGFMHDGNLYVTGRCKDVIILRGRNYYPQDIEATVQQALGSEVVRCVALATDAFVGDAMSVVIEVPRQTDESVMPEMVRRVRRWIIDEHEIDARQVVLTRPCVIPVTTSGKVKRAECRRLLESDEIETRYQWMRSIINDDSLATILPGLPERVDETTIKTATSQIQTWLMAWLVARCGAAADQITSETPFAEHGLDSMAAVELSGELDDWLGVELNPVVASNYPTPAELAKYLAEEMRGAAENADSGLVGN